MVTLIRSALLNIGARISVARTALCKKIEMASARRRMRRSRVRCAASPSTRHPHKGPRFSSWIASETFLGSDDITHLHSFWLRVCSPPRPQRRESQKILRRRFPGGCSGSPGDRRRARRDVRLRASSLLWTPSLGTSSQYLLEGTARANGKKRPKPPYLATTCVY